MKKLFTLLPITLLLLGKNVLAHCPLCTLGAAAAAGGAAWLGVDKTVIGLFLGAFAVSLGWWMARIIKKKYIPLQKTSIITLSFFLTIIPLLPLLKNPQPFYVSFLGDYGTILNRTYLLDMFLMGSVLGALLVTLTPFLSAQLTSLRHGKIIPFQGTTLTLILLFAIGGTLQILL